MNRDNGLWVAHEGQCPGIGLDRVEERDYYVVLHTKTTDDC